MWIHIAQISGVEAESEAVEGAQPEVAASFVAVGLLDRRPGRRDTDPGQRLGRERDRLALDHRRLGAFSLGALEQVEHDVGAEAGGSDAEPGVAGRVRNSS